MILGIFVMYAMLKLVIDYQLRVIGLLVTLAAFEHPEMAAVTLPATVCPLTAS